jgi:hypothetical protein
MNREEILKLCASNPEAIVDYIGSLEPTFDISFDFDPPKRPDCSLDLYKPARGQEICGYVYIMMGDWLILGMRMQMDI